MTISRILVANRGEIAARIVRSAQAMGIEAVVAVSEADRESMAARLADRVVCIGNARPAESYLRSDALLSTALGTKCDAIHPGYGFLAENAPFAKACEEHGVIFIGPPSSCIESMGNKLAARKLAVATGVPVLPGTPRLDRYEDAAAAANDIGYPILIKAAAGGGGRGIRVVESPDQLRSNFESASAEAEAAFGDGSLFLERYVRRSRHVEVQVFGDSFGTILHFGDRDCSTQRRYQKVIEEAPAVLIPDQVRTAMHQSAIDLCTSIGYVNAGTIEYLYDEDRQEFAFLEMNTRIQVEHPVTEAIAGVDLVQLQISVASGDPLPLEQGQVSFAGHAIECRITAEDPTRGFFPSPGRISRWEPPDCDGVRLDTHVESGYVVPPYYDSLLGKLIVWGESKAAAIQKMRAALDEFEVQGIATNIPLLRELISHPDFEGNLITTRWLEDNLDSVLERIRREPSREG